MTILAAWAVGYSRASANVQPVLHEVLPEAVSFENIENGTYLAVAEGGNELGYVGIGEAIGYGGPIRIAVAINSGGEVVNYKIVDHKETPSYVQKVLESDFSDNLIEMSYQNDFILDEDIDGISGATYTSRAMVQVVAEQTREIASKYYDYSVPEPQKPKIQFGLLEITLVLLYGAGYLAHRHDFQIHIPIEMGLNDCGVGCAWFYVQPSFDTFKYQPAAVGLFSSLADKYILVPDAWRHSICLYCG